MILGLAKSSNVGEAMNRRCGQGGPRSLVFRRMRAFAAIMAGMVLPRHRGRFGTGFID
jgi:hypothetical protein